MYHNRTDDGHLPSLYHVTCEKCGNVSQHDVPVGDWQRIEFRGGVYHTTWHACPRCGHLNTYLLRDTRRKGRYVIHDYWQRVVSHDKSDCAVRAFQVATGLPYGVIHYVLGEHYGRDTNGIRTNKILDVMQSAMCCPDEEWIHRLYHDGDAYLPLGLKWFGYRPKKMSICDTVSQFRAKHMSGTWFVMVIGHVFCMVDGVIHDTHDGGERKRVYHAFRVTDEMHAGLCRLFTNLSL